MARFANPALQHRTRQIAMDGSQKLPAAPARADRGAAREAGSRRCARAGGRRLDALAGRADDAGARLYVDDPLAERLAQDVGSDALLAVPVPISTARRAGRSQPGSQLSNTRECLPRSTG